MTNRMSLVSLLLSCMTCCFLIIEWFSPVDSLALLVAVIILSVIGFICAIFGIRKSRSALSIVALILGFIAMGVMILVFGIMFIMGLGA